MVINVYDNHGKIRNDLTLSHHRLHDQKHKQLKKLVNEWKEHAKKEIKYKNQGQNLFSHQTSYWGQMVVHVFIIIQMQKRWISIITPHSKCPLSKIKVLKKHIHSANPASIKSKGITLRNHTAKKITCSLAIRGNQIDNVSHHHCIWRCM